MFRTKLFTRTVTVVAVFVLALGSVQPAYAAQPANDNFAAASVISALPFYDVVDNTEATTELDEPQYCYYSPQTVWYSFTPTADALVRADMYGSNFYDTTFSIYQAMEPGLGGLSFINCASWGDSINFNAQAGVTYYFQVGSMYSGGGELHLNLQEILPPQNDDFANATVISSLPFADSMDTSAATFEASEPTPSCEWSTLDKTVWYAFKPDSSGSVSVHLDNSFDALLGAYTGNALTNLTEFGCFGGSGFVMTFRATAGTTYYFQIGGFFGAGGALQFHIDVAPPPLANFWFSPYDPSVFDTVQFYNGSYDPANAGFQSMDWDFGDGTTSTDWSPTHKYAVDGDYTVNLTATTVDGRTASATQFVQVKTHDVGITKISAPQSAKSGQAQKILVEVKNRRYAEYVQVELYKSVPGGFQWVGSYTQYVPVRSGNQTSTFTFNYTFTKEDASQGKVTFKAVATIGNFRDAWPADNELISSPPTKVTR